MKCTQRRESEASDQLIIDQVFPQQLLGAEYQQSTPVENWLKSYWHYPQKNSITINNSFLTFGVSSRTVPLRFGR
jgi:hypothetical protein